MRNDAFIPAIRRGKPSVIQPTFVELVVPLFSYSMPYDIPSILAEYPITNTVNISIRRPMSDILKRATSFALAVRSLNREGMVVRYVLHRPAGFYGLLYPDYAGQVIYAASANIEVWGIPGEETAESIGFVLYTGPLTFAGTSFCGGASNNTQSTEPVIVYNFSGPPGPAGPQGPPGPGATELVWVDNIAAMLALDSADWVQVATSNSYGLDGIKSTWLKLMLTDPVAVAVSANGDSVLLTDDGLAYAVRIATAP